MIEDNFFRTRPSSENIQEGDSVTFLERGNLIRAEKRQGVIYESILKENDTKNDLIPYFFWEKSQHRDRKN